MPKVLCRNPELIQTQRGCLNYIISLEVKIKIKHQPLTLGISILGFILHTKIAIAESNPDRELLMQKTFYSSPKRQ